MGKGLWNTKVGGVGGTMPDALTARDDNERTQVPTKANRIVVECKIRVHCVRSRDGTRMPKPGKTKGCSQEGKKADVGGVQRTGCFLRARQLAHCRGE